MVGTLEASSCEEWRIRSGGRWNWACNDRVVRRKDSHKLVRDVTGKLSVYKLELGGASSLMCSFNEHSTALACVFDRTRQGSQALSTLSQQVSHSHRRPKLIT